MSVADHGPPADGLTPEEIRRYSRHLIIPEVGVEGQERLKAAKVLLVGAGGLGSPLSLYLAAAGVGTLGLVEFDRVDESNLQRQILYGQPDVGRPKLEAAIERLRGVNPYVRYVPHPVRLDSSNALDLFEPYDVIVDGTDNFPTRYLVNDACLLTGKPNVYGSIFRFEGQVSVFAAPGGPCYRCLFPEPPPPGVVPSCAEGGVLGVLPGIIGSLQANEVVKLALGIGEPLVGRLLLFDALQLEFRELKLSRNPECAVCGDQPTQTELIDYAQFCGLVPAAEPEEGGAVALSPAEAQRRVAAGALLLDVRNSLERRICELEGSLFIPTHEIAERWTELDPERELVVYCHHGIRSAQVVSFLSSKGFRRALNLRGGIDAWSLELDTSIARY